MDDIYCYEGTNVLRNKLNIREQDKLDKIEVQKFTLKIYELELEPNKINKTYDSKHISELHKFAFGELYEWAGEFRKVNLYKDERVLSGASVEYAQHEEISKRLKEVLNKANGIDWRNKDIEKITDDVVETLTNIWEVHPFREGNTRTCIAFMEQYLDNKGISLNTELLKSNSQYVRDSLVLSTYFVPQHLRKIIRDSITFKGKSKSKNVSEKIKAAKGKQQEKYKVPKKAYYTKEEIKTKKLER